MANFFCKGPDGKYLRLCEPRRLCHNHSTLPLWHKSGQRRYRSERCGRVPSCTALPQGPGASFSQGTEVEEAEPNLRCRLHVGTEWLRDGHAALGTSQSLSGAVWLAPLNISAFSSARSVPPASICLSAPEQANRNGATRLLYRKSPSTGHHRVCHPGAGRRSHRGLPAWRTAMLAFLKRGPWNGWRSLEGRRHSRHSHGQGQVTSQNWDTTDLSLVLHRDRQALTNGIS